MNSKQILSAEQTGNLLINADIRINDATKRLVNLSNSGRTFSEIRKILAIESTYINKVVLKSLRDNVTYYTDNTDVMIFWNLLERSLLKFKRVYERLGKSN